MENKNRKEGNGHSFHKPEARKRLNENKDGRYGPQIKKMLNEFIPEGRVEQNNEDITVIEVLDEKSNSQEYEVKNYDDEYLFELDTRPRAKDDLDIPTYKTRGILLNNSIQKSDNLNPNKPPPPPSRVTCFNCLGEHLIRDCRRPRNPERIHENKTRLLSKNPRYGRYHKEENEIGANDFMPGQLSDSLVQALGLQKGELPLHIYRMRIYGYPPGWLEEARIVHSGLTVFDSTGKATADPNDEEGEILEPGSKDEYDFRKIWDFPGFNVPGDFIEEADALGYPPMSYDQSKEVMLKELAPRAAKAYRRRRQKPLNQLNSSKGFEPNTTADMDLSDISDCETIESSQIPLPPPAVIEENTNDTNSLSELENQKLRLLEELENVNSDASGNPEEENTKEENTKEENTKEEVSIIEACQSKPSPVTTTPLRLRTTSVNYGTPIIESISPYISLPDREKFSHDIQDVINFENLPNATGKYEAMNGLLHKVRKEVQRLQNEDGNL